MQANPLALLPDFSRWVVILRREVPPHCLWLAAAILVLGFIVWLMLPVLLRMRRGHRENTSGIPSIPKVKPQSAQTWTPVFTLASGNRSEADVAELDGRPKHAGGVTQVLLDLVDLADDMADLKSRATAGVVQEYSFLEGRLFDIFEFPGAHQRPPEIAGVTWFWYDSASMTPALAQPGSAAINKDSKPQSQALHASQKQQSLSLLSDLEPE